jgi:hypothetical protein
MDLLQKKLIEKITSEVYENTKKEMELYFN